MLKQTTESDGDGGYVIASSDLPSWLSNLNGTLVSFAFWLYRKSDAGTSRFRSPFVLNDGGTDFFGCRMSTTSGAASLRANNGTIQNWRQGGGTSGNLGARNDEWSLVAGYLDGRGTNFAGKLWHIGESQTNPNASSASIEPDSTVSVAVADMSTTLSLKVAGGFTTYGSHLLHGVMGGLVFWKDVQLAAADVTTLWNSKNPALWEVPASGNIPGKNHDATFVLPHCPAGNPGERGGGNTEGLIMGDAIGTGPEDILSYRFESGVTDDDTIHKFEPNTTFPTQAQPMTFFNPLRGDPV